jgi:hypothetical protein
VLVDIRNTLALVLKRGIGKAPPPAILALVLGNRMNRGRGSARGGRERRGWRRSRGGSGGCRARGGCCGRRRHGHRGLLDEEAEGDGAIADRDSIAHRIRRRIDHRYAVSAAVCDVGVLRESWGAGERNDRQPAGRAGSLAQTSAHEKSALV